MIFSNQFPLFQLVITNSPGKTELLVSILEGKNSGAIVSFPEKDRGIMLVTKDKAIYGVVMPGITVIVERFNAMAQQHQQNQLLIQQQQQIYQQQIMGNQQGNFQGNPGISGLTGQQISILQHFQQQQQQQQQNRPS